MNNGPSPATREGGYRIQGTGCTKNLEAQDVPRIWRHWLKTFENFLTNLEGREPNQPSTLINFVAPSVYEIMADCETYDDAITTLAATFKKPKTRSLLDIYSHAASKKMVKHWTLIYKNSEHLPRTATSNESQLSSTKMKQ